MKHCPVCAKDFEGLDACPDDGSILIEKDTVLEVDRARQSGDMMPTQPKKPRSPTPQSINIDTGERASLAATLIKSETSTRFGRAWIWLIVLLVVVIASALAYFFYRDLAHQATEEPFASRVHNHASEVPE